MNYPKIKSLELENFQAFREAYFEFDESNSINLKGYNNSGKSVVIRALDVLLSNAFPKEQANFIHQQEDYFRIILNFEDGISILRDKYRKGHSLYEMYDGDELIFTTKQGNVFTSIKEVPEPIQKYLGLTTLPSGRVLNIQRVRDPMFLIETTGSQNTEMLNDVLQVKETTLAQQLIKDDLSVLKSDLTNLSTNIGSHELSLERYFGLEQSFISKLEELDKDSEESQEAIETFKSVFENLEVVKSSADSSFTLETIDYSQLSELAKLYEEYKVASSLTDALEIPTVQGYQALEALNDIVGLYSKVNKSAVGRLEIPKVQGYQVLTNLGEVYEEYKKYVAYKITSENAQAELNLLAEDMANIQEYCKKKGISISKCDNCGNLVLGESGHLNLVEEGGN